MTECILFFHFFLCEKAQKGQPLTASNTVNLVRKRGLRVALAVSCDILGVLLIFRFHVSTAAASPPWGQREDTHSPSLFQQVSFLQNLCLASTAAFGRCSNKKTDLFCETDKVHCFRWPPRHCFSGTTSHLRNH